jgi:hypothetical protein
LWGILWGAPSERERERERPALPCAYLMPTAMARDDAR